MCVMAVVWPLRSVGSGVAYHPRQTPKGPKAADTSVCHALLHTHTYIYSNLRYMYITYTQIFMIIFIIYIYIYNTNLYIYMYFTYLLGPGRPGGAEEEDGVEQAPQGLPCVGGAQLLVVCVIDVCGCG